MFIIDIIRASWILLAEMAPYLLLGFFTAGLIHAFIPPEVISQHLSGRNIKSVVKASLLGVPLPLCSCGVIPVAEHLRREGAEKGAVVSFLISTPTTGVDSLLATYSLLGLPITIFRMLAAFVAGIIAGVLSVWTNGGDDWRKIDRNCCCSHSNKSMEISIFDKLKEALAYGFLTLVSDTRKWIIIGIILGGIIEVVMPDDFVSFFVNHGFIYPAILFMAIPMYICATGSIPVAAALIAKGLPPGAAIIFLVAGPATNTVTVSFVKARLGAKVSFIYLFTIIIVSLVFALFVDNLFSHLGWSMPEIEFQRVNLFKTLCALILVLLFSLSGKFSWEEV